MPDTIIAAAVPEPELAAFRKDPSRVLTASRILVVDYFLAYSVSRQPLGTYVMQALDMGEVLDPGISHATRPPFLYEPDQVRLLHDNLKSEWARTCEAREMPADPMYDFEIPRLIALYGHAVTRGECVVTRIGAPGNLRWDAVTDPPRFRKKPWWKFFG